MLMEDMGLIIHTVGELAVAYTVLRVHHRVLNEHKIDDQVFRIMRIEQIIGLCGVLLIAIGLIFELIY